MLANTSSGNESDPEISNFWKLPIGHLNPDPMACLGRVMKIMGAFPWISSLLFKFLRHTKSEWDRDPAILRPGTHIFFYPSFVCCLFSVRPSLCLCSVCPAFCVSLSVSSSVPFVSKIRAYSISIVILWLAKDSKQLDLANQPSPTQRVPRAGLVCCFIFIFYFFFDFSKEHRVLSCFSSAHFVQCISRLLLPSKFLCGFSSCSTKVCSRIFCKMIFLKNHIFSKIEKS